MFQQEMFELLVRKRPEAVMVRATLEQAFPPSFVDEVFERVAERQHTRKLLFSTLVQLLSLVVCKARSAVNSAIKAMQHALPVKRRSVYDKLNAAEPQIAEALLRESAARMAAVVDELDAPLPPLVPGYKTRILDGNHLAATDHRPRRALHYSTVVYTIAGVHTLLNWDNPRNETQMPAKLTEYSQMAEEAKILGVAQNTLRKWAKRGEIPMNRNPANGHRLYRRADLEKFLHGVESSV